MSVCKLETSPAGATLNNIKHINHNGIYDVNNNCSMNINKNDGRQEIRKYEISASEVNERRIAMPSRMCNMMHQCDGGGQDKAHVSNVRIYGIYLYVLAIVIVVVLLQALV